MSNIPPELEKEKEIEAKYPKGYDYILGFQQDAAFYGAELALSHIAKQEPAGWLRDGRFVRQKTTTNSYGSPWHIDTLWQPLYLHPPTKRFRS